MWLLFVPNHLKLTRFFGGFPLAIDPSRPGTVAEDSRLRLVRPLVLFAVFAALQVRVHPTILYFLFFSGLSTPRNHPGVLVGFF